MIDHRRGYLWLKRFNEISLWFRQNLGSKIVDFANYRGGGLYGTLFSQLTALVSRSSKSVEYRNWIKFSDNTNSTLLILLQVFDAFYFFMFKSYWEKMMSSFFFASRTFKIRFIFQDLYFRKPVEFWVEPRRRDFLKIPVELTMSLPLCSFLRNTNLKHLLSKICHQKNLI